MKQNLFADEIKRNRTLFLMILPATVYFLVFHFLPMLGIVLAFKNFNYRMGVFGSPFVGLKNFSFLYKSGVLWRLTKNTFLYNIAFIITDVAVQVPLAIMISEIARKSVKKTVQSVIFLPYFVSYVLLSAFVYNLFNYEHGFVNSFLETVGAEPVDVYSNPKLWIFFLIFFYEWKGMGYGIVIYLAALTGISNEYYEAARMDGANKWTEIRYITLPMLKPTIAVLMLFAVGRIMKGQFELFYQIIGNNGHLFAATDIIDTYVFRSLTQIFEPGMGTAAGLYQSLISFILIVSVNYIVGKLNPDYRLF